MKKQLAIILLLISLHGIGQVNPLQFSYADKEFAIGQKHVVRINFNPCGWGKGDQREYINPEALDSLADFLKANITLYVELGLHTDSRMVSGVNMELSIKRAQSVTNYLIAKGIAANRLVYRGYGETKLTNHCADGVKCTEEEHQANRRLEVKIVGFNKIGFDYGDTVFYVGQKMRISRILFMTTPWGFSNETYAPLDTMYNFMVTNPGLKFEIGSYTDCRSSTAFNLDLSLKRAKTIGEYLISKGIAQERLTYVGYGETQPLNKCVDGVKCTEEKHQENRRTEFKIIKID